MKGLWLKAVVLLVALFPAYALGAEYWAPRNSDIYHLPTCSLVKKMNRAKLLVFLSRERAEKLGYKPCKICRPQRVSLREKEQTPKKKEAGKPQKTEPVKVQEATKEDLFEKAFAGLQAGDIPGAIEMFTEEIEAHPGNEKAYYNRGLCYAMVGRHGQATEDFGKAVSLSPQYASAYMNRGIIYLKWKEYDRAEEDFKKAVQFDPTYPVTYYNMACLYAQVNKVEQSCDWLGKAIDYGYSDWQHLKTDSDLDAIRGASCFQVLMKGKPGFQ
jgi:tetratricopeptide (TPR) repeat protein